MVGGFGLALFRYRLWDIDLVVRRSLVYGALWLAIAGVYVGLAAGLGLAAGRRFPVELAIGLTALTTLAFQPARRALEGLADRWVFGRRESPLKAMHSFGELLGSAERPGDIAGQLAETAAAALGLAWVQVELDGSLAARVGARNREPPTVIAITRRDEQLGEMVCCPHPGERLTAEDRALLAALASQAGLAASHAWLASRIVQAQESERRRIERNIHDGAQQELVALVAQLGLARAQSNGDGSAGAVLSRVQRAAARRAAARAQPRWPKRCARCSALCSLTTSTACSTPGSQPASVSGRLSSAASLRPVSSTASGGATIARKYSTAAPLCSAAMPLGRAPNRIAPAAVAASNPSGSARGRCEGDAPGLPSRGPLG